MIDQEPLKPDANEGASPKKRAVHLRLATAFSQLLPPRVNGDRLPSKAGILRISVELIQVSADTEGYEQIYPILGNLG
jgi:hypothetical protein